MPLIWTRKVDNKIVTRTLDTTQAKALRPLMDNSRRLRELTTELATLALQQVRDDPTRPLTGLSARALSQLGRDKCAFMRQFVQLMHPGFGGGFDSTERWDYVNIEEISRGTASTCAVNGC